MSRDEIRWQVAQMAAQGVRGFFIHARQGLTQPYLSEAYFVMVDAAIEAAEEYGLLVHLYDENPYPAGVAGGQTVLGQPHYAATELAHQTHDVRGGPVRLEFPAGKVLAATAYLLNDGQVEWSNGMDLRPYIGTVLAVNSYAEVGLTRYNQKRYFASRPRPVLEMTLPDRPYRIMVSVQAEVNDFKYFGHYVDVLNPDAIRCFLNLTHERYWKRYGDKFGKTVVSFFADEIAPGWSDRIPAAFQAEYGYDLCDALPALQDESHADHIRILHDLKRLQYKLFCEAFERPVSEWCHAHNLMYLSEKPSFRMSQLRWMNIPGCEPGHTKAGAAMDLLQPSLRGNAKATASAAYFYGKIGALDECYHSLGWGATLQDAKLIADSLLLMGIKYLVPHAFFYSTHALKKHDAPPSFFFQMPYWPLFGRLCAHVDRIGNLFEGTYLDALILVVEPSSGLPTQADRVAYARLQNLLMENHLDFHLADTDVLVEGSVAGEVLSVRDLQIKLILVPPMQRIEPSLQEWLVGWQRSGGRVIYCPRDFEPDEVLRHVRQVVKPSLSIQSEGHEIAALQVAKRSGPGQTLWFVLNTSGQTFEAEFDAGQPLREIPVDETYVPIMEKRNGRYVRTLHSFEACVLEASAVEGAVTSLPVLHVPLRGQGQLRLGGQNLLRLDEWRMSLLDANGLPGQTATVPALPISNQLDKGNLLFAPKVRQAFGNAPELDWPMLGVRYETSFENQYSGPVELVVEPGSLVGAWRMVVNGEPFGPADLAPTTAHVRGSLGKDITACLRPGENVLGIELLTDQPDGGLLNPLYLAGNFGVELNPARLVPGVQAGCFEQYEENKLPFYSGMIEYALSFDLASLPSSARVVLQFEAETPFHDACEISVNGSEWRAAAWLPRRLDFAVEQLCLGTNALRIRVYTTLSRSFEGQWFDVNQHRYRMSGDS